MKIFKNKDTNLNKEKQENVQRKQIGLEIKLPGCDTFVPLGKSQYNRVFLDDIGPRLLIVVDEAGELLEPSGIKSTEGKEEDALKQEITGLMKSITQLGRSSGIHMVIAPLRLCTLIPTVNGYTTMQDIKIGDTVFDKFNKLTNVVGISEIKMSKEMYEIEVINSHNNNIMLFGADFVHRFPVVLNNKIVMMTTPEMILNMKVTALKILGCNSNEWDILSIKKVPNELVKCIEVDSDSHLFLITDKRIDEWEKSPKTSYPYDSILTHNTQRNDASVIPGIIQNNSLDINTKLRIRRKI